MRVDITLPLEHSQEDILRAACKKAGASFSYFKIARKSIDARRHDIKINYSVILSDNAVFLCLNERIITQGSTPLDTRPVIVGAGPAGLFAGYYLAKYGFRPIIIERGGDTDSRTKSVDNFWKKSILNPNSNMQFGEGGAGTFSDGKLTTRINDERCREVLEILFAHGAPEEVLYLNKPHVGTDKLRMVVKNLRNSIIKLGGEVIFNRTVQDIRIENCILTHLDGNPCQVAIFAIGHSARDTYKMLHSKGVAFSPKPFAIGVRVEHKQIDIDIARYGKHAGHPALPPAEYLLAHGGCFTFCNCPGGIVVASSSDDGEVITNGMSYFSRSLENANSAVLVGVNPAQYGSGIFDGIEFQRKYESLAYQLGGGKFCAPVQLLGDFLRRGTTKTLGSITPSYTNGYTFAHLDECLPDFVTNTIRAAFSEFDKKIKGFSRPDAPLTGVETRTSAPIRIERGETGESLTISGLYPCGEGAGYAGGIMSAATDGIKIAEKIIGKYSPAR